MTFAQGTYVRPVTNSPLEPIVITGQEEPTLFDQARHGADTHRAERQLVVGVVQVLSGQRAAHRFRLHLQSKRAVERGAKAPA